jgi:CheY-like chemotaxis protein
MSRGGATGKWCWSSSIVGGLASHGRRGSAVKLLDLGSPKADGMEVLKQVRSDPDLESIPGVVITSSREEQDLLMAMARARLSGD